MNQRPDFLILGQGLLGSLLALDLCAQGASVIIADFAPRRCSSLVSAGMMDPISGQRFALSWRYEETTTYALSVYEKLSSLIGHPLITPRTIYRLFRDTIDSDTFHKKYTAGTLTPYIADIFTHSPHPDVAAPFGGVTIQGGYHIEVGQLIHSLRQYFIESNQLLINPNPAVLENMHVKATIHCTGAYAHLSHYFSWLPFRNSRGETIIFDAPDFYTDSILNNGNWIAPMKTGGYRAGATYAWESLFHPPTEAGYIAISAHIKALIPKISTQIMSTESGTRSIMADSRPVIGQHPIHSTHWVASGLGSKGTQIAPFISSHLSKSLIKNTPIDDEISINRFLKKYLTHP
jgi:glycine/D-amino acid oxidase-like deaminating enzyme